MFRIDLRFPYLYMLYVDNEYYLISQRLVLKNVEITIPVKVHSSLTSSRISLNTSFNLSFLISLNMNKTSSINCWQLTMSLSGACRPVATGKVMDKHFFKTHKDTINDELWIFVKQLNAVVRSLPVSSSMIDSKHSTMNGYNSRKVMTHSCLSTHLVSQTFLNFFFVELLITVVSRNVLFDDDLKYL